MTLFLTFIYLKLGTNGAINFKVDDNFRDIWQSVVVALQTTCQTGEEKYTMVSGSLSWNICTDHGIGITLSKHMYRPWCWDHSLQTYVQTMVSGSLSQNICTDHGVGITLSNHMYRPDSCKCGVVFASLNFAMLIMCYQWRWSYFIRRIRCVFPLITWSLWCTVSTHSILGSIWGGGMPFRWFCLVISLNQCCCHV